VHNSISEYASTADISTTPHFHNHGLAIPFYFILKEIFEEYFSPHLSSKSSSTQRDGALKRERERERKYWKKEEEKEKLQ
jgi:hypothetical protein